jgi:DNA-binding IclR family transcriptional regulator
MTSSAVTSSAVTSSAVQPRSGATRDDANGSAVPRSIGRVLDLLETVLEAGRCTLTTAAAAVDLTPTTALRHLRALEVRGYVDRDASGQFSVGPTMMRIAGALHDGGPLDGLIRSAQPVLDELASATGESTYLAVSDGRVATYVATAESERAIRHVGWIGQNVTLHGTAVGEALARPGICVTRNGAVEPDITAMSLALPPIGRLGVAVSIIGPHHRFGAEQRETHARELAAAADQLGRQLGVPVRAAAS